PATATVAAPAPSDSAGGLRFVNVTSAAGVNLEHRLRTVTADADRIAAGVAAGDVDGDGYLDLYVIGGDDATPDTLYRNAGTGTLRFDDVTAAAGLSQQGRRGSGPAFADVDGDGDADLFVGAVDGAAPSLWLNDGDGGFVDGTDASGFAQMTRPYTFSAAFGDVDLDGDLDAAFSHWDWQEGVVAAAPINDTETLWRNGGDGRFDNVSVASTLATAIGADGTDYSFAPNFADIDSDGYPDLLMASDFGTSQVLLNNRDGTFSDATTAVISDRNGMGAAVGDYDNDGDLDWFVTAIAAAGVPQDNGFDGNRLYRNDGGGRFDDVTDAAGVRIGGWGWAACFADFDNDGWLDLFHVNGWYDDRFATLPARLFMADGNGGFDERALAVGLTTDRQGRGVVCADLDRDGDIDLFIANNQNVAELYENRLASAANWLTVQLRGAGGNTQGVGARVIVSADGVQQLREVRIGSHFVSQTVAEAHFGLGAAARVSRLEVVWPGGERTELTDVAVNRVLVIAE
ncbi:MAG: CRTAC1 family protein, partial [Pseudomonadota bacterium]